MQGRTIMIAPRKIKHMAEKMERENLELRTFLKCSADEKNQMSNLPNYTMNCLKSMIVVDVEIVVSAIMGVYLYLI